MSPEGELGLLAILLVLSSVFSGSEIGFLAVSPTRARHLRDQGVRTATWLRVLQKHRAIVLGTILFCITTANYTAERLAVSYSLRIDHTYGPIVAAVVMALIVIMFCEILPIQYAARHPEKVALRGSVIIGAFTLLLLPIVWTMATIARLLLRILGVHAKTVLPTVTEDHLMAMIDAGEQQGTIEPSEKRMLRGVLEFGDYTVAQIMTPRPDMICIEENQTLQEALDLGLQHRHSRLPVYSATPDDIAGVLNLKDLLPHALRGELHEAVSTLSRPAYHVPESLAADALLAQLQRQRTTMAIVKDEYGGTAGIVTVEDLLEEIVGDIRDEYDIEEQPEVIPAGPGEFLCDGRVSLHELESHLNHIDLPTEDYESLAGLVMDTAGHVPVVEEAVNFGRLTLTVEEMDGPRIRRVRVVEGPAPDSPEGNGAR